MKEHKIYFTIWATILLSLFIGLVLGSEIYEAREEASIPLFDKAKAISTAVAMCSFFYLAGTEYHSLKNMLKKTD